MMSASNNNEDIQSKEPTTSVTLPWIPELSSELFLKKLKKTACKAVLKSNDNINIHQGKIVPNLYRVSSVTFNFSKITIFF